MTVEISAVGGSGTVSPTSPLGSALLGHKPGDTVDVPAPRGAWRATIKRDPLGYDRAPFKVNQRGDRGSSELERLVDRSRLIGSDPALVLHGGGNTSTKLVERDHLGRERRVLRIKGSGSDLATARPPTSRGSGSTTCCRLRERDAMSDEEMVAYLSRCLVEPDAARPSIETLLHAFLPAAHVDHVHADAICALANAPDPDAAVREALGAGRRGRRLPAARLRALEARRRARRRAGGRARPPRARHVGRDARGVVRADARARRAGARLPRRERNEPEPVEPDGDRVESFLVRLRGRLSRERRSVLAIRAARSARSRTAPTSTGSRRCGARPTTCSGSVRARASSGSTTTSMPRSTRSGRCKPPSPGSSSSRASVRSQPRPDARAAAARGRDRRAHASLGRRDARPVRRRELARRGRGARLRALAARALQADARAAAARAGRARSCSSPAPPPASGATSLATSRRGAHLVLADIDDDGLDETSEGLDRAVAVSGDLTEPRCRRPARPHCRRELRRPRRGRLQRGHRLDRRARRARRRRVAAEPRRQPDRALPAHDAACSRCCGSRGSAAASSTSRRRTPSPPVPASARTRSRRPASSS